MLSNLSSQRHVDTTEQEKKSNQNGVEARQEVVARDMDPIARKALEEALGKAGTAAENATARVSKVSTDGRVTTMSSSPAVSAAAVQYQASADATKALDESLRGANVPHEQVSAMKDKLRAEISLLAYGVREKAEASEMAAQKAEKEEEKMKRELVSESEGRPSLLSQNISQVVSPASEKQSTKEDKEPGVILAA